MSMQGKKRATGMKEGQSTAERVNARALLHHGWFLNHFSVCTALWLCCLIPSFSQQVLPLSSLVRPILALLCLISNYLGINLKAKCNQCRVFFCSKLRKANKFFILFVVSLPVIRTYQCSCLSCTRVFSQEKIPWDLRSVLCSCRQK